MSLIRLLPNVLYNTATGETIVHDPGGPGGPTTYLPGRPLHGDDARIAWGVLCRHAIPRPDAGPDGGADRVDIDGPRGGEPLPCPFCGATPKVVGSEGSPWWFSVRCPTSGCPSGPAIFRLREAAVAAWNRRAPAPAPPGRTFRVPAAGRRVRANGAVDATVVAFRPMANGDLRILVAADSSAYEGWWPPEKLVAIGPEPKFLEITVREVP